MSCTCGLRDSRLAVGLLVGLERGWRTRDKEDHQRAAGLRKFALSGLLGGVTSAMSLQAGGLLMGFGEEGQMIRLKPAGDLSCRASH